MPSVLGALFLVAVVGALATGRRDLLPWILSAAVPFTATAGLTAGGQSILVYPVVAIVLVGAALAAAGTRGFLLADVDGKPGLLPLLGFTAWAIAVTLTAPILFEGVKVLDPRDGIDIAIEAPSSLSLQVSNVAQCVYLLIGVATVITLATCYRVSPRLPAAGFAVGTVVSSARSLLPEGLQRSLLDNSANVTYTAGEFDGVERMRGVFSEPSALGAFSVAAVVFFVMLAAGLSGWRRYAALALGAWAAVNLSLSVSGGAIVSGLVVAGLVAARFAVGYAAGRQRFSPGGVVATLAAVPVLVVVGPQVVGFVSLVLTGKSDSTSFEHRNAADAFSYALSRQTDGIGVGIGSNRPSSFLASLLSTTGVIGVVLFTVAVLAVLVRTMRFPAFHPAAWALLSILVSKIVSGPDLSDPPMWFLLAVCAAAVWRGGQDPVPPGPLAPAVPSAAPLRRPLPVGPTATRPVEAAP